MRGACWISKTTDTHPEYGIVIAFATAAMVALTRLNTTLLANCYWQTAYLED